jgi:hypothetical protein
MPSGGRRIGADSILFRIIGSYFPAMDINQRVRHADLAEITG